MDQKPNDQYNAATPDSAAVRVGLRVRHRMFDAFMRRLEPRPTDTALDIGVTSDQTYAVSNYFEALYPFKAQITGRKVIPVTAFEVDNPPQGINDFWFDLRHFVG